MHPKLKICSLEIIQSLDVFQILNNEQHSDFTVQIVCYTCLYQFDGLSFQDWLNCIRTYVISSTFFHKTI